MTADTPAMRCAECDCENGGTDCNWIASTPAPQADTREDVEAAADELHHYGEYEAAAMLRRLHARALAAESALAEAASVMQRVLADAHWRTPDNSLWPDLCEATRRARASLTLSQPRSDSLSGGEGGPRDADPHFHSPADRERARAWASDLLSRLPPEDEGGEDAALSGGEGAGRLVDLMSGTDAGEAPLRIRLSWLGHRLEAAGLCGWSGVVGEAADALAALARRDAAGREG